MDLIKENTIARYNKQAGIFAEKFKNLFDLKKRYEFQRFLDLLKGKKVLDVGCGSGDHAKYFVEQGLSVVCVDLAEEMVNLCKLKGLNVLVMDLEDLQFSDNSFDGIWAVTSLLHVAKKNLPKVITKLHHLLRRDGILYVCVREGEGEKLGDEEPQRFFAFWKKDELLTLFKKEFDLIEYKKIVVGKRVFLEFFFKKSMQ